MSKHKTSTSTSTVPPVPTLDINRTLYADTLTGQPPTHVRQMQKATWAFLHHMEERGWKVSSVNDGDAITGVRSAKGAMELAFNLDECWLRFTKDGRKHTVFLCFCNSPEEIVADWGFTEGDPDGFDAAVSAFDAEAHI